MPMVRSLLTDPAAAGGHVVAVGDAQGRLLWVEGDRDLRTRAESMGFVAGTQWSEHAAGTNAPAPLSRWTPQCRSSRRSISDRFSRGAAQQCPSTIRIPGGSSGVDVTGQHEGGDPQALAMVRATAMAVEQWLATQQPATDSDHLLVLGRDRGC